MITLEVMEAVTTAEVAAAQSEEVAIHIEEAVHTEVSGNDLFE